MSVRRHRPHAIGNDVVEVAIRFVYDAWVVNARRRRISVLSRNDDAEAVSRGTVAYGAIYIIPLLAAPQHFLGDLDRRRGHVVSALRPAVVELSVVVEQAPRNRSYYGCTHRTSVFKERVCPLRPVSLLIVHVRVQVDRRRLALRSSTAHQR